MKKRGTLIIQICLFIFLVIYFTRISPLQPFDGDDWRYIGSMRLPLPLWGAWNPTRVLAETLMPLGGYVGAFVIYPIFGNYLWALTFAEALIVASFIVTMFFLFYNLLVRKFNLSKSYALAGEILFFLSCFLLFKHVNQPSYTAFWTVDLCCNFYYLIPGLLNASIVMYILQYDNFISEFNKFSNLKKGLFILVVYFAIFSSTQLNIILATFAALKFLDVLCYKKGWIFVGSVRKSIIQIGRLSWVYIAILIFWLLSVAFELSGKRAANRSSETRGAFGDRISAVFGHFLSLLGATNRTYLILSIVIILLSIIIELVLYHKKKLVLTKIFLKMIIGSLICLTISFVYLFLVYFKAGDIYESRPDAMWAVIFFFLFSANLSFIYLFRSINLIKMGLPLLLFLEALVVFNFNYPPMYPKNSNHDAATIYRVNSYIISQIKIADKKGNSKVVVRVPLDNRNARTQLPDANWPHSYVMGTYLQDTLYNHRITRTRMHIIFKPDKVVNQRLYENTSNQQPATPIE